MCLTIALLTTFSKAAREGVVTVKIGSLQVEYVVHKALLTHHSGYFAKAFNGSCKESEEIAVLLEDVECCTCKLISPNYGKTNIS